MIKLHVLADELLCQLGLDEGLKAEKYRGMITNALLEAQKIAYEDLGKELKQEGA